MAGTIYYNDRRMLLHIVWPHPTLERRCHIAADQQEEFSPGMAALKLAEGVGRVGRSAPLHFEVIGLQPFDPVDCGPDHLEPHLGWSQAGLPWTPDTGLLPGVVCDRQENKIKIQAVARLDACQNMAVVRWIEGSAENADPAGVGAGHVGEAT